MPTTEFRGKKIKFPDTMSPDDVRAVLKVMESPGKYAKLKSDSERMSESLDKLAELAAAIESNGTTTRAFSKDVADCMELARKQQAELIRTLGQQSSPDVNVTVPQPAYTFKIKRDKDGQMTSVEATPNG